MPVFAPWRPQLSRRLGLLAMLACAIPAVFLCLTRLPLPRVSLQHAAPPSEASKLALLIEDRPLPVLAPLMLHFMAVLPPDWRFLFLGSAASMAAINASAGSPCGPSPPT